MIPGFQVQKFCPTIVQVRSEIVWIAVVESELIIALFIIGNLVFLCAQFDSRAIMIVYVCQ